MAILVPINACTRYWRRRSQSFIPTQASAILFFTSMISTRVPSHLHNRCNQQHLPTTVATHLASMMTHTVPALQHTESQESQQGYTMAHALSYDIDPRSSGIHFAAASKENTHHSDRKTSVEFKWHHMVQCSTTLS
jgi:hypothetical protein